MLQSALNLILCVFKKYSKYKIGIYNVLVSVEQETNLYL